MKVLTAETMRALDQRAIREIGIPGLVLMENAAVGVVEAIFESYPEASSAAIFCGPGNNGGDGLAIARRLDARGCQVLIFLVLGGRELTGDAATQLAICRQLGLAIEDLANDVDLAAALDRSKASDLAMDALFGTGLDRPLQGFPARVVEAIGRLALPVVAVDVPSGLSGSRADLFGPHVTADLTVTFAAPKIPHVLSPAAEACGALAIAELGFPSWLIDEAEGDLFLMTPEDLASLLPRRAADAHKGSAGHALLVAGSPGKSGAAILAARAAVRGGAGLVTVAVSEPILPTVDLGSLESMTLALPAGPEGELGPGAADAALGASKGKNALALGPGLGQSAVAQAEIRRIALETEIPFVLDADGLNAFEGSAADLAARRAPAILTPHPGELGRLLGISSTDVQADRLGAARRAAVETGAVVVLKGHRTLIASEAGVWINPTGNPGMATGGAGDVLTGLLAALLAQGLEPLDAARLGVYLHGLAGDLALDPTGAQDPELAKLTASDLIDHLAAAARRLAEE
ncbi:MAG TPA: NAD(P)H-hydrate dehydratase [Thermoanaerobaculia bacterium]|nr:NAD(P)H-hydrate dehydratase [Thermoanaerobaculia bacterium]